ncbi:hypothetical protein SAMN05444320_102685 [Streptoalloteichus hindustanus]|uniref:Uncharacterized protein n=2 Tax=Streptoalloteichus hindustanus TaxID=2017 RepID=A0A1M4ZCQ5_STRHI|nr:hypothetical protein SAMN05444320_102685 [Streptoalloteichus hindustanus]
MLLTGDLREYALAASVSRRFAAQRGLSSCQPVCRPTPVSGRPPPGQLRAQGHYRTVGIPLDALTGPGNLDRRARALRHAFFPAHAPPVVAAPTWPPGPLARAVFTAVSSDRPLVFAETATALREPAPEPGGHWVLADSRSPLAVVAAGYAAATGKRFAVVERGEHLGDWLRRVEHDSAILVAEHGVFGKPFLQELATSRQSPLAPGVMTAYSAARFSRLVWRLLAHRDFRAGGGRFGEPDRRPVPLRDTAPLEHYVLSGHGNELHVHHGDDEVVCGAFPVEERTGAPEGFDCERGCPYPGRIRGADVPVTTAVLLSCESATFGDGFAPRGHSVLLNLLDGWCTSVIAPYKHAMVTPELESLAEALVRGGYRLGEIAERLNSLVGPHGVPDAPFVLLGDPELVPATTPRVDSAVRLARQGNAVVVECRTAGSRVLDSVIPLDHLGPVTAVPRGLAVEPVSAELVSADVRFAFRSPPTADSVGVLVFGRTEFPAVPLRFRLRRAALPTVDELDRLRADLRAVADLSALGLDPAFLAAQTRGIADLLDPLLAYPRLPESILNHTLLRHYDALRDSVLRVARRAVLGQLREILGETALWISHRYAGSYGLTDRTRADDPLRPCPRCAASTSAWRYTGGCRGLAPRTVEVCPRCGIVADTPDPAALDVTFAGSGAFTDRTEHRRVTVRNLSTVRQDVSLFAQFTEWRAQGISVEPGIVDTHLGPGEETAFTFTFSCRDRPHDELASLHVFALTARFALSCFTQRVLVCQAGTPTRVGVPAGEDGPNGPSGPSGPRLGPVLPMVARPVEGAGAKRGSGGGEG